MTEHSTVAVFNTLPQAKDGVEALVGRGFPRAKVALVAHEVESKQELHGYISGSDQDSTGAFRGGAIGGIVGLCLGATFIGIAQFTTLGESGAPVQIAGAVGLAMAGAVFGALVGGMSGRGVKEARVEPYDDLVRAGKSLVVAHGTHDQMTEAQTILRGRGAVNTKVHHAVSAPADTTRAVG